MPRINGGSLEPTMASSPRSMSLAAACQSSALSKLALRPPEDVEAGRELQRRPRIDAEEAPERDASVVLDATEHLEMGPLRPGERCRGFA
jgi:hypothetical protein